MIAVLALAAAAAAGPGLLQAAETAFAQGDYRRADELATAAAEPPQEGAALYLAGLARFRSGHPAEALEALDRAARASDPPAPALFHYNRAACLYQLERFAEAEADYLEAASLDPALATVSFVNASYAALDAGSSERAKELAARARASAKPEESDVVSDLESHIGLRGSERATAEYREGLAAYDAGRFEEARTHFRRASELDPADGRALIMSGASSYQLGARSQARTDLNAALRRPLDDADTRTARDYLQAVSGGLPARKMWEGAARLAAGFDNDPLQTGFFENDQFTRFSADQNASPVATANVAAVVHPRLRDDLGAEFSYVFAQLAYLSDSASDLSLQQHELASAIELALRDDVRVGGSITGQLAFTGVSKFRGLQAAGGGAAWGALDEGDYTTTRVDLGWMKKEGIGLEFDYLTGMRADAAVTQQLRLKAVSLELGYRFRAELIGSSPQTLSISNPQCPGGICTQTIVDPLAYTGSAVWTSARTSGASGSFEVTAGYESRNYLDATTDRSSGPGSQTEIRRRRHDDRWFGGFAAASKLTSQLTLSLRYDLLIHRSNNANGNPGPGGGGKVDFDDRNYDRHVLLLGTTVTW